MTSVQKWLLVRANEELQKAKSALMEEQALVDEFKKRVVDPEWNLAIPGEGESTWGGRVREHERRFFEILSEAKFLESVVKELEES